MCVWRFCLMNCVLVEWEAGDTSRSVNRLRPHCISVRGPVNQGPARGFTPHKPLGILISGLVSTLHWVKSMPVALSLSLGLSVSHTNTQTALLNLIHFVRPCIKAYIPHSYSDWFMVLSVCSATVKLSYTACTERGLFFSWHHVLCKFICLLENFRSTCIWGFLSFF